MKCLPSLCLLFLVSLVVRAQEAFSALALNSPVERELAGGAKHSYPLPLIAGQFVQLVVEQRGIDVVVVVFAPTGQQLLSVDSPNGTQGPEPVAFVAEAGGAYRVEVQALEKGAAVGRYEIKLLQMRDATPQDRSRLAAQQAYAEAEQLRAQQKADALRQSIQKYEASLPLWRAAGDQRGEATALNNLSWVHLQLGAPAKAITHLQQALVLWRALGDRREEATALNNIGQVYTEMGQHAQALTSFEQSLQGARALSDRALEGTLLHNLGNVHYAMGESQRALDAYTQALPLLRAVGDRSLEASTTNNLGTVYRLMGEHQKALDLYLQMLPIFRALGNRREVAATLHNLGDAYTSLGDSPRALEHFNQALPLWRELGNRRGEAASLNEMGKVYQLSGGLQQAVASYTQALSLRQAVGDRRGQAITLSNLGAAYIAWGELPKAQDSLQQSLTLWQELQNRAGEAVTRSHLAQIERTRGNLSAASAQAETALTLLESVRTNVASQELRASFRASQQGFYEFYIDLLMQSQQAEPAQGWQALALETSERARARGLLEMLAEARADLRQGVDAMLLERERNLQQQLNAKEQDRMRLASGNATAEARAAIDKELRALTAQYEELQTQIRTNNPRYAALTQPQPLKLSEIQQQILDGDTLLLEYALGASHSYLWVVSRDAITSYELPKRTEIEEAARSFYQALSAVNSGSTPSASSRLTDTGAKLSQMLLAPVAAQLGNKRLLVVADGALQYVPFSALPDPVAGGQWPLVGNQQTTSHRPPVTGHQPPFIVKHEIISLPSASSLAMLRRELAGRKPAAKALALFADPVFAADDARLQRVASSNAATAPEARTPDTSLARALREAGVSETGLRIPRLPGTRREAAAISAFVLTAERKQALDFEASRAVATSAELSQYRILHFATHGLLNSQNPELSGLVLSLVDAQGKPQDGFLRLHEIYNLKLPAELVVLSACQTGLGKEVKGEGLVGLTRGFMYAGAARVMASLWKVDDRATAELMKNFYQGMIKDGLRPAAALRAAQIAMWKQQRWQEPYYWAAFVLQGEWK